MSEMRKRLLLHLVRSGKMAKETAKQHGLEGFDQHMEPSRAAFGGEVKPMKGLSCPKCGYSLDHIPVANDAGEACPVCGYGWAKDMPREHGGIKHFEKNVATERSKYARGGMVECKHCGYKQDRGGGCVRCGHEIQDEARDFARALRFRRR